jgi:hypothetical protein
MVATGGKVEGSIDPPTPVGDRLFQEAQEQEVNLPLARTRERKSVFGPSWSLWRWLLVIAGKDPNGGLANLHAPPETIGRDADSPPANAPRDHLLSGPPALPVQ